MDAQANAKEMKEKKSSDRLVTEVFLDNFPDIFNIFELHQVFLELGKLQPPQK